MLCSAPPNTNLDEIMQKVIIEPCLELEAGAYYLLIS
jgi:hypothetical protein